MRVKRKWGVLLLAGGLMGFAPQSASAASAFEQLIEQSKQELQKTGGKLRVALDWTKGDVGPVLEAFKKEFPWIESIEYNRETGIDPFGRYLIEIQQGIYPPYDIMHVASEFQQNYWEEGAFVSPPFSYMELNASRPSDWPELDPRGLDPDNRFLSTSANIRGNVWNPLMISEEDVPKAWADCVDPKWKGRIIHDARNKNQTLQFDATTREAHLDWLRKLKANDVVLVRGQAQLVQRVAAGEIPIGCFVNFTTAQRLIDEKKVRTLRFGLADTVPVELGTRLFIPKWSQTPATVQLFAFWVATKGQPVLDDAAYRGQPWTPGTRLYEEAKGKYISVCSADCAAEFERLNLEFLRIMDLPLVEEAGEGGG